MLLRFCSDTAVISCMCADSTVQFGFVASDQSCFHCDTKIKECASEGKGLIAGAVGRYPCSSTSASKNEKKEVLTRVPGDRRAAPLKFPYSLCPGRVCESDGVAENTKPCISIL